MAARDNVGAAADCCRDRHHAVAPAAASGDEATFDARDNRQRMCASRT